MKKNNMVAMILAGGRGSRLFDLTKKVANRQFTSAASTASSILPCRTVRIRIFPQLVFLFSMNRSF